MYHIKNNELLLINEVDSENSNWLPDPGCKVEDFTHFTPDPKIRQ